MLTEKEKQAFIELLLGPHHQIVNENSNPLVTKVLTVLCRDNVFLERFFGKIEYSKIGHSLEIKIDALLARLMADYSATWNNDIALIIDQLSNTAHTSTAHTPPQKSGWEVAVENLYVDPLFLAALLSERLITRDENECIMLEPTARAKASKLIQFIEIKYHAEGRFDPDIPEKFRQALIISGQSHLVEACKNIFCREGGGVRQNYTTHSTTASTTGADASHYFSPTRGSTHQDDRYASSSSQQNFFTAANTQNVMSNKDLQYIYEHDVVGSIHLSELTHRGVAKNLISSDKMREIIEQPTNSNHKIRNFLYIIAGHYFSAQQSGDRRQIWNEFLSMLHEGYHSHVARRLEEGVDPDNFFKLCLQLGRADILEARGNMPALR
jgi:hypothetical protein